MNILILNWRDIKHPLAGGAEISLFEHAKYWIKNGADVTWFSASFKNASSEQTIGGVKIIREGSHYTTHIFAFIAYSRLLKKPDIVIDCFHFIPFFTPLYIQRNKIIALINEPAKNAWFKNIFFPLSVIGYILEPLFFRMYYHIPFITSAASIVIELLDYGIQKRNIFLIPHGIEMKNDTGKKTIKEKNVIMYLGQLSEDKGIKDALYAFYLLKEARKDMKLWVIGKAVNRKFDREVKQLIHSLSLEDNVLFYGYVSEEKKMKLLAKVMILIHPSIREGWGLTVIEANTLGVPAIGYNVTGLKDSIQDKTTGLLTEKNTPESLAKSINLLMNDKNLYALLSKNAVVWSKKFSWLEAGDKSWKLLKRVYG